MRPCSGHYNHQSEIQGENIIIYAVGFIHSINNDLSRAGKSTQFM